MGNTVQKAFSSDPYPETFGVPQFDAHYGFSGKREERPKIKATKEDMIAVKIEKRFRDYCVDQYIELLRCHQKKYPYVRRCATEQYDYYKCEYDDQVLRMKEYERERRLLIREKEKMESQKMEVIA
ncbi:unnamed protein product [Xylocopa violacea]|uniref:NADH dehydrogenase [ubiquinone] 1 beta subcomplex subunit 7 n=1 Tax=Xylocopa violacea TaxID=135666 RepID=A0ABP1PGK1_XYLVO